MASRSIALRDALADALSAYTLFTTDVTSTKSLDATLSLRDVATLKVIVLPPAMAIVNASRGSRVIEATVPVIVVKHLPQESRATEVDSLLELVDELQDWFTLTAAALTSDNFTFTRFSDLELPEPYDFELMRDEKVFHRELLPVFSAHVDFIIPEPPEEP